MEKIIKCNCGGEAKILKILVGGYSIMHKCYCTSCNIRTCNKETPEEAIESWNAVMRGDKLPDDVVKVLDAVVDDNVFIDAKGVIRCRLCECNKTDFYHKHIFGCPVPLAEKLLKQNMEG